MDGNANFTPNNFFLLFSWIKKYKQLLLQSIKNCFSSYQIKHPQFITKNEEFFHLIHIKFNKKIFHSINQFLLFKNIKIDTNTINQLSLLIDSKNIQIKKFRL